MKAITIHQPYAWAVIRGIKRFENRCWATAYRGPLAIHAGKSRDSLGQFDDWDPGVMVDLPPFGTLPFGAFLGTVDLIDCLTLEAAEAHLAIHCPDQFEFADGPYCWLLANPRPLPAPIPGVGKLGLFEIPNLVADLRFA